MATEVVMPKMGYDMTEGTVLRWTKQPGDEVHKGDVLGEIETGKVNIEIEAFDSGVLGAVLVGEGSTVPVGTPIAVIVAPGEAVPDHYRQNGASAPEAPAAAEAAPAAAAAPLTEPTAAPSAPATTAVEAAVTTAPAPDGAAPSADGGRVKASPLARRMARDEGLDLARVTGTGPGGRVVRDDIVAALAAPQPATAPATTPATAAAPQPLPQVETEHVPLSRMRQTIARRLAESWTSAPHIFVTMAIDMSEALALREQVNTTLAASGAGKVSVNDLVVKAAARSLRLEPRMNASFGEGERIEHGRIHIGVAIALEDGLVTLTVPDADRLPLSELSARVAAMAERARAGKLQAEDLSTASTFTISNLGMYGVEQFTAILNPPEAGILAIGAAIPTPVARDGEVVVRPIMKVTLSADHRVVDGATAAQFLVHLKQSLEQPLSMLV
jgi:pyruvate dehydrogenase E2 component (dihydrolipoamide acetyltransferase)